MIRLPEFVNRKTFERACDEVTVRKNINTEKAKYVKIAEQYGRRGLAWVCEATGMSHNTVKKRSIEIDPRENKKDKRVENKRIRREGGGRKKVTDKNGDLIDDLKRLVESATRGDPMSPYPGQTKAPTPYQGN
jgi:hypothetical protein